MSITLQAWEMSYSHEIKRRLLLKKKKKKKNDDKPRQCIKKQKHFFANKSLSSQSYGFSSSHVRMWELEHKKAEDWRTDDLEPWF